MRGRPCPRTLGRAEAPRRLDEGAELVVRTRPRRRRSCRSPSRTYSWALRRWFARALEGGTRELPERELAHRRRRRARAASGRARSRASDVDEVAVVFERPDQAVGGRLVSPVARTMSVNDRAPSSTASITSAARSMTADARGGGRDACGRPAVAGSPVLRSRTPPGLVPPFRLVRRSALGPLGRLLCSVCPNIGTEFHYMEQQGRRGSPDAVAARPRGSGNRCPRRSRRRSGSATSSAARRASRTSSTSTCTSCTRSPARRRSTGSALHGRPVRRPGPHGRDDGPQRPHHRPARSPTRSSARQMRGARDATPTISASRCTRGVAGPGHRARDRPRAGVHAARHDDRLRRLAHVDARRVRRARVRHRHQRGRARPRDADACRRAGRSRWRSRSTASSRPTAAPRTSSSRSSAAIGTGGGVGHVIEYRGSAIRGALDGGPHDGLQHVDRRPARGPGMVAPDDTTFAYVEGRPHAPKDAAWEQALDHWRSLADRRRRGVRHGGHARRDDAAALRELGHEPRAVHHDRRRRSPTPSIDDAEREAASARSPTWPWSRARRSARSARHDLHRFVHELADRGPAGGRGRRPRPPVKAGVRALVVPGTFAVKLQAEHEGLDDVFDAAGFEWRGAGCSMCLGMNPDILAPGDRSASTSNRNFEGRQGKGGRTHLVSPAVAAATAIAGHFTTPGGSVTVEPSRVIEGTGAPARPRRRRHRPDHPRASTSSASSARASGRSCSPSGARTPRSCSTIRGTRARRSCSPAPTSACGSQPRARAVGDRGLRLPRGDRAELRRHLPQQLHEDRAAAGRAPGRSRCGR